MQQVYCSGPIKVSWRGVKGAKGDGRDCKVPKQNMKWTSHTRSWSSTHWSSPSVFCFSDLHHYGRDGWLSRLSTTICGYATKVWPMGCEQLLGGDSEGRRHIYNVAIVVNWLESRWWGQQSIEMATVQPKDSRSTTPWCHCTSPAALTLGLRWRSNPFPSCWPTFESFYDSHPCIITKTTLIHPVPKAGTQVSAWTPSSPSPT